MHIMFQFPMAGNAGAQRSQSLATDLSSSLSSSLRFKVLPSSKQEQAIKANLRGLGYGGS
jgi:hypothetical protein